MAYLEACVPDSLPLHFKVPPNADGHTRVRVGGGVEAELLWTGRDVVVQVAGVAGQPVPAPVGDPRLTTALRKVALLTASRAVLDRIWTNGQLEKELRLARYRAVTRCGLLPVHGRHPPLHTTPSLLVPRHLST